MGQDRLEEARRAVCQTKSTTPGIDEIPVGVLKEVWPYLGTRITALFQACVSLQVHPRVFKKAEVLILPKSGKRDRTLPSRTGPLPFFHASGKDSSASRRVASRISRWSRTSSPRINAGPRASGQPQT